MQHENNEQETSLAISSNGMAIQPAGFAGVITKPNNELSTARAQAQEQYEIQSAITIAKQDPRNEWQASENIIEMCKRPGFADKARYIFKRGKVKNEDTGKWEDNFVEGPSVKFARQAAQKWGNIRFGLEVIREDENTRLLRGWAWDLETNTKVSYDDLVEKVIERKRLNEGQEKVGERKNAYGDVVFLIRPDERDLRELQNRRGAFLIRNAILQLIPFDIVESGMGQIRKTLVEVANQNLPKERGAIIAAWGKFGVTLEMLESLLKKKVGNWVGDDIAILKGHGESVRDGNSKVSEIFPEMTPDEDKPTTGAQGLNASIRRARENSSSTEHSPATIEEPPKGFPSNAAAIKSFAAMKVGKEHLIEKFGDEKTWDASTLSSLKEIATQIAGGAEAFEYFPNI